jgi:L-lactate dehydrogenase complex protein LldG
MDDAAESAFIARIQAALRPTESAEKRLQRILGPPEPDPAAVARRGGRSAAEKRRLIESLATTGAENRVQVMLIDQPCQAGQALAAVVADREPEWGPQKTVCAWNHPLIKAMDLEQALSPLGFGVAFTDAVTPAGQVEEMAAQALVGVTSADFCIAATATLVLRSRPDQHQSLSLLPSIHAAIITADQVIADLAELYARLRLDNPTGQIHLTDRMTLITGPSKTADIEATLVYGAHGPRELLVFVITGASP